MLRSILKVAVVLLVLMAGSVCAESPFNVDLFCGWNGYYRPMEWTPVEVGIAATREPLVAVDGAILVPIAGEQEVDVGRGQHRRY